MAYCFFLIIFSLFLLTECSIIPGDVPSSKSENLADYSCPVKGVYRDYSLIWRIENYNFLSHTAKELISPEFPPAGPDSRDWHIEFVPLKISKDSKDFLKLSFRRKSSKEIQSIFHLTISTDSGKFKRFKPNDNNLDQLLNVNKLYSALDWDWNYNKSLIISTTIRVLSSTIHSCKNTSGDPTDSNNLFQDIYQYLSNDKTLQDFTITVQGKEFSAHKDILAARSSVFSRMFSEDREQGINRTCLEINDFSPETVENMITFIYTDNVDDLVLEKLSSELLSAARLYDLKKLAAICMGVMYKNPTYLNVDNVLGALEAADKFSISYLKNMALKFVVSHRQLLKDTDKFKSLTAERPDLMVELSEMQDTVPAISEDAENMDIFKTIVEFRQGA